MSANRKFALSGSTDQTVRLWDVETGKCLRVFNDGREDYLVAGNEEGTVKVWNLIWELKAPAASE